MKKVGPSIKDLPKVTFNPRKEDEKVAALVKHFHDKYQPEAYIATQTSASGSLNMIREAYKVAYPGENMPKFLTVDPRVAARDIQGRNAIKKEVDSGVYDSNEEFRLLVDDAKEKVEGYELSGNIVVIDEALGYTSADGPESRASSWQIADRAVRIAKAELGYSGKVVSGGFDDGDRRFKGYWDREENLKSESKDPNRVVRRKRKSLDDVSRLENLGSRAGKLIIKQKGSEGIEGKLLLIAAISLTGLIFLNQALITGNVIKNYESYGSAGFIVLASLLLIAAYFLVRINRK